MKGEAGDPGVIAVPSPELASQVGGAGLGSRGNDGFQREIDEGDPAGVAHTRGIDKFGPVAGCDSLRSTVELGCDEDEAAPRGQPVAQHEVRQDVLAAQLLEAGAGEDGARGVAVETARLRCFDVAGSRCGSRTRETLDELQLDGDDRSFTVGGDGFDEGVQGGAVAEVGVVEPARAVLEAESGDVLDEARQEVAPDPRGEVEVSSQRGEEVEGQRLRGEGWPRADPHSTTPRAHERAVPGGRGRGWRG